jgi:hypothetical protein
LQAPLTVYYIQDWVKCRPRFTTPVSPELVHSVDRVCGAIVQGLAGVTDVVVAPLDLPELKEAGAVRGQAPARRCGCTGHSLARTRAQAHTCTRVRNTNTHAHMHTRRSLLRAGDWDALLLRLRRRPCVGVHGCKRVIGMPSLMTV